MKNAVCPKCGHVYPWQTAPVKCKFCKTNLTVGICLKCHSYTEDRQTNGMCRSCHNKACLDYIDRIKARYATAMEEWQAKLQSDLSDPLTEEEWLDTVSHFNGCAFCKETDIAARQLLLPRRYGGRYTKTNVIPICEKCAKILSTYTDNIFRVSHNTRIVTNPNHFIDKQLPVIIEYLSTFIKEDK